MILLKVLVVWSTGQCFLVPKAPTWARPSHDVCQYGDSTNYNNESLWPQKAVLAIPIPSSPTAMTCPQPPYTLSKGRVSLLCKTARLTQVQIQQVCRGSESLYHTAGKVAAVTTGSSKDYTSRSLEGAGRGHCSATRDLQT